MYGDDRRSSLSRTLSWRRLYDLDVRYAYGLEAALFVPHLPLLLLYIRVDIAARCENALLTSFPFKACVQLC